MSVAEVNLVHASRLVSCIPFCTVPRPSIPSHGTEGLWAFSFLKPAAFEWGCSMLELCTGLVLHLAAARDVLQTNRRIRAKGSFGHLRFVVPGKHGQAETLQIRVTGISFGIPSMERLVFVNTLTEAVRNSVDWLHAETWRPVTSNRMLDPGFVVEDLSDDELWARRHRLAGKCP